MSRARSIPRFVIVLASASFVGCVSSNATPNDGGGGKGGELGGSGGSGGSDADITATDLQPDSPENTAPDTGTDVVAEAGGCAAAGYQLCDDFEGAAPGDAASAWTFIKKGAYTIAVDTTQAHSGTHSVHATATAAAGYAYIQETKTFPATDFWVRAYLRLVAPPGGHEVFAGADTNMDEGAGDQVRFLNSLGGGIATNRRAGDRTVTSKTAIPMNSWDCYEWHETPDGVHVFLNGQAVPDADWLGAQPVFVALVFGVERFGGGKAGDIWIDDVAVNSTQVGCK